VRLAACGGSVSRAVHLLLARVGSDGGNQILKPWPWLAALVLTVPASAALAQESPTVLPLEPFRKSVAVRAEIAGKERLLMFDTGGAVSFISPELASELACEKGVRVIGFRMTGDRLETPRCDNVALSIAGHEFPIPIAGVYQTGELAAAGVTVDGLLALDVFAGRTVTLDFAGGRLIVETPASAAARVAGATELPARLGRELGGRGLVPYIDVPSSQGTLEFELDSGNGGTLLIAKPYAAGFGFDPDEGPRMGSFPIGAGIAAEGLVIPADITLDGNLGMPFLKDYIVTLDLARGRVWLQRNTVAPPSGMGAAPPLPKD